MMALAGKRGISIHAPRTGSDGDHTGQTVGAVLFQSTLPARGATERQRRELLADIISIHAPRTGSDCRPCTRRARSRHFNPRSPHGERRDNARLK